MEKNTIEVGDFVRVDFNASQCTLTSRALVLNTPMCQGESWILRDVDNDNKLIYLSEPCTITKLQ